VAPARHVDRAWLGLSFAGSAPRVELSARRTRIHNSLVTACRRIAPEAVQEYRVSTMNYTAEYGATSGACQRDPRRAERLAWYGIFYLKNDVLNAKGSARCAGPPASGRSANCSPGRVGGPLLRRRLFLSSRSNTIASAAITIRRLVLPTAGFIKLDRSGVDHGRAAAKISRAGDAAVAEPRHLARLDRYLATTRSITLRLVNQAFCAAVFSSVDEPDLLSSLSAFSSEYRQRDLSLGGGWTRVFARIINICAWLQFRHPRSRRPQGDVPACSRVRKTFRWACQIQVSLPGSQAAYAYRNRNGTFERSTRWWSRTARACTKFGGGVLRTAPRTYTSALGGGLSPSSLANFRRRYPPLSWSPTRLSAAPAFAPTNEYAYSQSFLFFDQSLKLAPRRR